MQIIPKGNSAVANSTSQDAQPSARDRAIARMLGQSQGATGAQTAAPPAEVLTAQTQDGPQDLGSDRQTAASEESQAPQSPEATSEKALAPRFADLARKEKAVRAQVQQLKAKEAELRMKEEAFRRPQEAKAPETAEQYRARLSSLDPASRLKELGLSYDEITQSMLNQPSPEQQMILELKNELKSLRDAQDKTTKTFEESKAQSYQQALNQIRNETKSLVSSSADYETIRETQSVDDVVDLIEATFKEEGRLMTVDEAAREVEEFLIEEALKVARLNKIQQRLKPKSEPTQAAPAAPAKQPGQPAQGLKTLTNATSAQRPMSARERAILAFNNKLTK